MSDKHMPTWEEKEIIVKKQKEANPLGPQNGFKPKKPLTKKEVTVKEMSMKNVNTAHKEFFTMGLALRDVSSHGKIAKLTHEELVDHINQYFEICFKYNNPPSKSGLATCLGVNASTINRRYADDRYKEIFDFAYQFIESNTLAQAEAGNTNNIVAIFKLKTNHDYIEAHEITLKNGSANEISVDERDNLLDSLKNVTINDENVIDVKVDDNNER